jgi:spore coat polysaccharide biosynthesis protein SpsF
MDTEVFSFEVLERAYREGLMPADREHVTPYIYRNPERFRLASLTNEQDLSFHRWTVDTPEDFELVRRLLEALYPQNPEFTMSDALFLLERNPEWIQINSMVEQKKIKLKVVES